MACSLAAERPLSKPITAVRHRQREPLFMPRSRPPQSPRRSPCWRRVRVVLFAGPLGAPKLGYYGLTLLGGTLTWRKPQFWLNAPLLVRQWRNEAATCLCGGCRWGNSSSIAGTDGAPTVWVGWAARLYLSRIAKNHCCQRGH